MKKYLAIIILVSAFALNTYGQNTYRFQYVLKPYSSVVSIVPAADSGTITINRETNICAVPGGCNYYISAIHFNKSGKKVWSKSYATNYSVHDARSVATKDGGFAVLAGLYDSITKSWQNALLIKCDKNGDLLWQKQILSAKYAVLTPQLLAEDNDGNLLLFYIVSNDDYPGYILQTVKLTNTGTILWNSNGFLEGAARPNYFFVTSFYHYKNRYYIVGNTNNQYFEGILGANMLMMDTSGIILKSKDIYAYTDENHYLSSTRANLVFVSNNTLFVSGTYSEYPEYKGFIAPLEDTPTVAVGVRYRLDKFATQYFLKKYKAPFPLRNEEWAYYDNDASLTTIEPISGVRYVNKYDFLGRICPDYTLPTYDPRTRRKLLYIYNEKYHKRIDTVRLQDKEVTVFINEVTDSLICNDATVAKYTTPQPAGKAIANGDVKIYPNPAHNILHVTGITTKQATCIIVNEMGTTLKTATITTSKPDIIVADLKAGIYFLRIANGAEAPRVIAFVKD